MEGRRRRRRNRFSAHTYACTAAQLPAVPAAFFACLCPYMQQNDIIEGRRRAGKEDMPRASSFLLFYAYHSHIVWLRRKVEVGGRKRMEEERRRKNFAACMHFLFLHYALTTLPTTSCLNPRLLHSYLPQPCMSLCVLSLHTGVTSVSSSYLSQVVACCYYAVGEG